VSRGVLLVHGLPGSADDGAGLLPKLAAAGRHAVAVDLPGFGRTPAAYPQSVAAHARWLEAKRLDLGFERVDLVVHDIGGAVGLYWLAAHPDALA
jgi:pimeloyl-ACP methyl ester carboxylesterase